MLQLANGKQQFLDQNGAPLAGGLVYHYAPGTTNPVMTYKDSAGQSANTNPIKLDSRGQAVIWGTGTFRQVVTDSSGVTIWDQIVNAPDVNAPVNNLQGELAALSGASLIGFEQVSAGAVARTAQDKMRESVSVTDFGARGDGQIDDSAAFSKAAAYAASTRADVIVPPPAVSYLLSSDPVVPDNVNFKASPDWFTGVGQMPFHKFTAISEGVDPRIFSLKGMHYTQSEANESKRKWALVGWGYYGKSPSAAAAGTTSDMVGVDGRGVCDAFNGRVWGLLGLAHITAKAFNGTDPGVSQAYACELDMNNNSGHDVAAFDSGPITRGLAVVSGGTNRPAEAMYTLATSRPADGAAGDNRWLCGWRVYRDSVYQGGYIIHVDDGNKATFARIPPGCAIRHTYQEAITFVQYQDVTSKRYILWSQTPGYGYDIVDSNGNMLLSTNDGNTTFKRPLCFSSKVLAAPVTLDASQQDVFVLTAGQPTITGGITGGVNGQRITIWNLSGAPITLARNNNMRTAGGANVAIANLACVEFMFLSPTYFQIGPTNNA